MKVVQIDDHCPPKYKMTNSLSPRASTSGRVTILSSFSDVFHKSLPRIVSKMAIFDDVLLEGEDVIMVLDFLLLLVEMVVVVGMVGKGYWLCVLYDLLWKMQLLSSVFVVVVWNLSWFPTE